MKISETHQKQTKTSLEIQTELTLSISHTQSPHDLSHDLNLPCWTIRVVFAQNQNKHFGGNFKLKVKVVAGILCCS